MQDPWANFVQKGNGGSGGGSLFFGAANNTTNVHIRVDTPSDFNRNDQISNVLDGNWHYVSVTFESGTVKMYKDGLQTGSFSYIHGSGFGNTSNVFLGSAYGSQDFLLGLIDEVRIYNRALSASEVKALYNQSASKINKTPTNILTNGLVGHWTFDGADTNWTANTVVDRSGNGNTGAMINMSTSTSPAKGKIGQALNFDGVNDYVAVDSVFTTNQTELTMSAWVNFKSFNQPPGVIMNSPIISGWDTWSGGSQKGYQVRISHNTFDYTMWNININDGVNYNATLYDNISDASFTAKYANKWIHAVATFKGGQYVKLYLDGELKITNTSSIPSEMVPEVRSTDWIGRTNINSGYSSAVIDEVRVYNRALSASEVKSLYNQSASKFNKTPTNILTSGLVGHWTFDGADTNWTTNTVVDRSGNGNTGAMVNMSTTTSPAKGRIGQALKFKNTNEYISVADPASGILDPSYITISAWIKLNKSNDNDYIVSKDRDGGDNPGLGGYELKVNSARNLRGQIWRNSTQTTLSVDASSALEENTWYHTVMTFDGSNIRVYLNGLQNGISATVSEETVQPTTKNLAIGILSYNAPSWYPMNGLIDEVRVYNRALSASEVKALYNMGR